MNTFLTALFNGTSRGAIFALVALGLVLVWRGSGVVNFAQMGQAMFTTYIASTLIAHGNSYWIAFIVALIAGALLGGAVDLFVMRPLHKHSHSSLNATIPIIASLGILGVLQAAAGMFWAGEERGFPTPVNSLGLSLSGKVMPFTAFDLFVVGVVLVVLVLTTIFFTRTGMGLAMRASALNEEVARLSGIKVHYMKVLSWMISGAASSLAGLLVTPATNLSPNSLDLILIIGFTAAVVGGLDSLPGAVIGGFALGLVISFVNVYLTPENVFLAILLTLVLVLIVRPQGIMGSKVGRRV